MIFYERAKLYRVALMEILRERDVRLCARRGSSGIARVG